MKISLAVLLVALVGIGVAALADPKSDETASGKAAFQTVYQVLLSPRCKNCHPAGDAPLQFDDGRPHGQNITRRSEKNGLYCSSCHREKNGTRKNTPPGAPHWQLPPQETPMIFEGRTPARLCAQLKDRSQTGRDLDGLVDHVANDPLVLWGWSPGPGRTPVPVPHATLVEAMRVWVRAGAPCPE